MSELPRREFLHGVAAVAAASTVSLNVGATSAADDNRPLNVALIGCGGMGTSHLRNLLQRKEIRLAYVCDVDANRLTSAAKLVETSGRPKPVATKDLRDVLKDKAVDAVWIATPDHWHSPAAILACEAKKHVYVEKPVSHNVREGRLLIEAARKNKVVVQVGTQSRSTAHVRKAMELLQSGIIGDVLVAKAWNSQLRRNIGHLSPSQPPAELDFELWQGPAPERAFQANLLPGIWRFWYDYGVGDIGNDGVHDIDIARWGLGVNTHPDTVAALGSKFFFDDDQQFPDNQYCVFEWSGDGKVGNKRQLIYEQRDWSPYVQEGYENGNAFYGTQGVMLLGKGEGFKVFGPRNKLLEEMSGRFDLVAHHQNFIDCVRSGNRSHADVEEGHLSASLAHLANIACRTNRVLTFDPAKEQFSGEAPDQSMLTRKYRAGHWAVPTGA
ncbi:Inositol 2-dehydrogenase [Anatilimnocola aggregata]|uniref:Inositol 2-dehydrogenase n=1 Tax=Anatilimnocola aggregata TaxID=2528021 RepID=A0A517YI22_9BACT|nr:Gfo/Idh/MocA family oxidoreductase [Anatilimnocola aggregata]QDU29861.1 Inositol 2-dehydrogenase [Anatilimnocola aggregata]